MQVVLQHSEPTQLILTMTKKGQGARQREKAQGALTELFQQYQVSEAWEFRTRTEPLLR